MNGTIEEIQSSLNSIRYSEHEAKESSDVWAVVVGDNGDNENSGI